jgi:hypothetical protein
MRVKFSSKFDQMEEKMLSSLVEIFCVTDDFCKFFEEEQRNFSFPSGHKRKRKRICQMTLSEVMTILILFHRSDYRTFKHFYLNCVKRELQPYFPKTGGYSRFVQLIPQALFPLVILLTGLKGKETGLYFVDSTTLKACHIKREKRHQVFKGLAKKSKTSMGWFFGCKLHLVINQFGELMSVRVTPGNVDDRKPVQSLMRKLKGWLFGDKGYIGQEFMEKLKNQSVLIFTKFKKNMKEKLISPIQKYLLYKRGIVETVIDQLKYGCQIEHTRHRSPTNAFVNLFAGLVAYQLKPLKPSLRLKKISILSTLTLN